MKDIQKILHDGTNPYGVHRVPHVICLADFNTNYPNTNRIERIAREINEYSKYDRKSNKA